MSKGREEDLYDKAKFDEGKGSEGSGREIVCGRGRGG